MYVDDRAIYTTSCMINMAAIKAHDRFYDILEWLYWNSLEANPTKIELITFKKQSANQNLLSDIT